MSEKASVKILETGAFDRDFRMLIADDPGLGAKVLAQIEAFAASGAGDHSIIKDSENSHLVQLKANGYRVVMFIDDSKNEIYVVGLVREKDARPDILKNISAISMLRSALGV